MNDSFGDGFNTTVGGAAATQPEQKAEGLAPAVIKQIHEMPENSFQMWGFNFAMVTCVAIVRGIETSSTKITYLVEDHTGQIEAHYWLEEGESRESPDVMLNNYVRLFGTIRQHAGKKTLMIFKIHPVTDVNEITMHLLEVLNARYKVEEFSKKSSSEFGGAVEGMDFTAQGAVNPAYGLNPKQTAVYQAIKSYVQNEAGISTQELQKRFGHISPQELQSITEFLTQEGHIYTSIDSDHFLPTDAY